MQFQFTLDNESATDRLGAALAEFLPDRTIVGLIGPLGAGKTRLVQAVARAIGVPLGEVTSPTFVVVQEYEARRTIYHFDAFRLADEDEFLDLGPDEYFDAPALTFIEWADRIERCLPDEWIEIRIDPIDESARAVSLIPHGESLGQIAASIAESFSLSAEKPAATARLANTGISQESQALASSPADRSHDISAPEVPSSRARNFPGAPRPLDVAGERGLSSLREVEKDEAERSTSIPTADSGGKPTDIRVTAATMYLLPVTTRVPLKFGAETLTQVVCLRARIDVTDRSGRGANGWGETPISVQWAWPSPSSFESRQDSMIGFCDRIASAWSEFSAVGHPIELGHDFLEGRLPDLLAEHNAEIGGEPMPYLAALICASTFDVALHDAYGILHDVDIYKTYNREFMSRDLAAFLEPAADHRASFAGLFPEDFLVDRPPSRLLAWHLVGGLDPLDKDELDGNEPNDGFPVLLRDWIATDGLKCIKIKLRGTDAEWDFNRLDRVGTIAEATGVRFLSADFNCCVHEPAYVNDILDRLRHEKRSIFGRLLYVEQPFPYDLEAERIDVRTVAERKPIFLDESAHDWQHVRLGRELGWTGVALKTCKTQTGALLSHCWAKAHGMPIMVQDLTNPMIAQIPHVRLAAHVGTIGGVETNAMQFYPAASNEEATVHPGLYVRRNGEIDLSTIGGTGFGYRIDEIDRKLPTPGAK